jgi:predicted phage terminase large subunit-like protein
MKPDQRIRIKLPKLHKYQGIVARDNHRFKVLAAGRRFGKTLLCAEIALKEALEGGRVWWIAPTYQVAGLGWREVKTIALKLPIPYEIREAERTIRFPLTGGSISFKSAERPENLRGESLTLAVFDEADFIDEEVWTQSIRPALADRKGGAVFISTPYTIDSWYHKMFQLGQTGLDPDTVSWQFPSVFNPFLDPEEIEKARQGIPDAVYRREFLAEFVGLEGARVKKAWLKYCEQAELPKLDIVLGVDLAISEKTTADYTAVAVVGYHRHTGKLYVLDVQRIRTGFQGQIDFVLKLAEQWRPSAIGVEDVNYQRAFAQALSSQTKYAVRAIKHTKDKITRFAPVESRYQQELVFHVRGIPFDFERELLGFPEVDHDDQVDALSTAWEAIHISGLIVPIVAPLGGTRDVSWRGDLERPSKMTMAGGPGKTFNNIPIPH